MPSKRDPRKYRTIEVKIRDPHVCHMCGTSPLADDITYCPSCGFPQRGTAVEQRNFIMSRRWKRKEINESQSDIGVGRLVLFILAGFNLLGALIYWFGAHSVIGVIQQVIISVLYAGLGIWAKKKPYAALLTGLICYGTFIAVYFLIDPRTIFTGLFIKIGIFGGFIYGMTAVKKAEKLMAEMALKKMELNKKTDTE